MRSLAKLCGFVLVMFVSCRDSVSRLQLMVAPVIQGVRVPDDASDKIVHRNGKFIRNSFLPGDSTVSYDIKEYRSRRPGGSVKWVRRGRSRRLSEESPRGSRLYYLQENPEQLHADRSPYNYEPANYNSFQSSVGSDYPNNPTHQGPQVMLASNDDFIIQQQTYQMCPDCPTFSIPIPIPKTNVQRRTDYKRIVKEESKPTFLDEAVGFLENTREAFLRLFKKQPRKASITRRVSSPAQEPVSPLLVAGLTFAGIGVASLLSVGNVDVGRAFNNQEDILLGLNQVDRIDYDTSDPYCLPRNYCEAIKMKKYVIDQWPVAKRIGVSVAELLWDKDHVSERGSETWCNLRECVFSLLR